MPGESGARLTMTVGRREFEELSGAWASYLEATKTREGVDPVVAMQRTGTVLRSLEHLLATLEQPEYQLPRTESGDSDSRSA